MTNPLHAEWWEWDEGNEAELAKHNIAPSEVYEVWQNGPMMVPNRHHRPGDFKMVGLTQANRRVTIIIRFDEIRLTIRPITGWESTNEEKAKYF